MGRKTVAFASCAIALILTSAVSATPSSPPEVCKTMAKMAYEQGLREGKRIGRARCDGKPHVIPGTGSAADASPTRQTVRSPGRNSVKVPATETASKNEEKKR